MLHVTLRTHFLLVHLTLYGKASIAGCKNLPYKESDLPCYALCFAKSLSSWGAIMRYANNWSKRYSTIVSWNMLGPGYVKIESIKLSGAYQNFFDKLIFINPGYFLRLRFDVGKYSGKCNIEILSSSCSRPPFPICSLKKL